jgi:hypothetical protein
MGRQFERNGEQVRQDTIPTPCNANLLLSCTLCFFRIRNPVPVSHHVSLTPNQSNTSRCLAAVPIQFAEKRGWGPVTSELPFLALLLGVVMGGLANI